MKGNKMKCITLPLMMMRNKVFPIGRAVEAFFLRSGEIIISRLTALMVEASHLLFRWANNRHSTMISQPPLDRHAVQF